MSLGLLLLVIFMFGGFSDRIGGCGYCRPPSQPRGFGYSLGAIGHPCSSTWSLFRDVCSCGLRIAFQSVSKVSATEDAH